MFTRESDFNGQGGVEESIDYLEKIQVTVQEVRERIEGLKVREALGLDSVSGWVLREYRKQSIV